MKTRMECKIINTTGLAVAQLFLIYYVYVINTMQHTEVKINFLFTYVANEDAVFVMVNIHTIIISILLLWNIYSLIDSFVISKRTKKV